MINYDIIPTMETIDASVQLLDEGAGLASPPVEMKGLKGGVTRNTKGIPEIAQHRNRLGKAFISRMRADFQKHGIAVIERVRKERPAAYLELIARLMPQQMEINVQHSFVDLLMEAQKKYQSTTYEKIIEAERIDGN